MVIKKKYVPAQGDLVWLNFDFQSGHEQSGKRPALVISPASYNGKTSLALMCPVTSKVKGYPFEVLIQMDKISGAILADQIKNLDWQVRRAKYIAKVADDILSEVVGKLHALIDI